MVDIDASLVGLLVHLHTTKGVPGIVDVLPVFSVIGWSMPVFTSLVTLVTTYFPPLFQDQP